MDINELRRELASVKKEMRDLLQKGEERENKRLTDEEGQRWSDLNARADDLGERIGRMERMAELDSRNTDTDDREESRDDQPEKMSFGEMLAAVARSATGGGVDRRLAEHRAATGMNEGVPSEGGFLVGSDHSSELLRRTYEMAILASRCSRTPVGANSNGLSVNAVDESSRVTGSRWGGVQAYWGSEAGTASATKPKFRQVDLKLQKLLGFCYATDELITDATALEAIITQAFQEEFAWILDDAIMNANGIGKPLGYTQGNSFVSVAKEAGQAADTVAYENIVKMWSRMYARSRANSVWLVNQDVEPQLQTMSLAVGTGGMPVYMPPAGAASAPYATLHGRPVIPVEQCATLGDSGDIQLVDLSQYKLIDKQGIQKASSIHVNFLQDEEVFRFTYRVNGMPMWDKPLTPANGSNTLSPFVGLAERA